MKISTSSKLRAPLFPLLLYSCQLARISTIHQETKAGKPLEDLITPMLQGAHWCYHKVWACRAGHGNVTYFDKCIENTTRFEVQELLHLETNRIATVGPSFDAFVQLSLDVTCHPATSCRPSWSAQCAYLVGLEVMTKSCQICWSSTSQVITNSFWYVSCIADQVLVKDVNNVGFVHSPWCSFCCTTEIGTVWNDTLITWDVIRTSCAACSQIIGDHWQLSVPGCNFVSGIRPISAIICLATSETL